MRMVEVLPLDYKKLDRLTITGTAACIAHRPSSPKPPYTQVSVLCFIQHTRDVYSMLF